MGRIDNFLYGIEKAMCLAMTLFMTGIVGAEIFCRYCLGVTLMVGIQEIAKWTFVWLVAMGCAAMVKRKAHIAVEYFVDRFCPPVLEKVLYFATQIVLCVFFIAVVAGGFPFAIDQWQMRATAADIPKTYAYLSIPVSMSFMLFHTLTAIYNRALALETPQPKNG